MKLNIFFCQFPNPWTLRLSGMGGYTSKCEKIQNHCTLVYSYLCRTGHPGIQANQGVQLFGQDRASRHLGKPGCTVIWVGQGIQASRQTRVHTVICAGQGIQASRQTRMYSYLCRTGHPCIQANQDVHLFGQDRASRHLGKPGCTVICAGQGIHASRQTRMYSYLCRTGHPCIQANQDVHLFGQDWASRNLGNKDVQLFRQDRASMNIGKPGLTVVWARSWHPGIQANQYVQLFEQGRASIRQTRMYSYLGWNSACRGSQSTRTDRHMGRNNVW